MSKNVVDPGEGYRLLSECETLIKGDEWLNKDKWIETVHVGTKAKPNVYRRRIEPVDNTGVQIHTGGPYVTVEAYRAALKEIDRLQWELRDAKAKNPPKQQPEPEPEWFDLTPLDGHVLRTPIDHVSKGGRFAEVDGLSGATVGFAKRQGYTQFRCLLKDAPKIAKTCNGCGKPLLPENAWMTDGCPCNFPAGINDRPLRAEDPDEWVTQDRVPARPGVDERRWKNRYDVPDDWGSCAGLSEYAYHGLTTGSGHRLELRCRRRDLPPIPEPKPATQREVMLYWYDGNVVGRYADWPPTDPSFIPLIIRDGKAFIETETREVVR